MSLPRSISFSIPRHDSIGQRHRRGHIHIHRHSHDGHGNRLVMILLQ